MPGKSLYLYNGGLLTNGTKPSLSTHEDCCCCKYCVYSYDNFVGVTLSGDDTGANDMPPVSRGGFIAPLPSIQDSAYVLFNFPTCEGYGLVDFFTGDRKDKLTITAIKGGLPPATLLDTGYVKWGNSTWRENPDAEFWGRYYFCKPEGFAQLSFSVKREIPDGSWSLRIMNCLLGPCDEMPADGGVAPDGKTAEGEVPKGTAISHKVLREEGGFPPL